MGGLRTPPGPVHVHPPVYCEDPAKRREYQQAIEDAKACARESVSRLEGEMRSLNERFLSLQAEYQAVCTDRERLKAQHTGKPPGPLTATSQGSEAEARSAAQVRRLKDELAAATAQVNDLRVQLAAVPKLEAGQLEAERAQHVSQVRALQDQIANLSRSIHAEGGAAKALEEQVSLSAQALTQKEAELSQVKHERDLALSQAELLKSERDKAVQGLVRQVGEERKEPLALVHSMPAPQASAGVRPAWLVALSALSASVGIMVGAYCRTEPNVMKPAPNSLPSSLPMKAQVKNAH